MNYILDGVLIIGTALLGAIVVPKILDLIYKGVPEYRKRLKEVEYKDINIENLTEFSNVKVGMWVGVLERLLILICIYTRSDIITSIGIIIALKTLVRFKALDNKIFAEYYLLGTLISVIFTVVCYILIRFLNVYMWV